MDASYSQGNWEEQKCRLKEKFAALKDSDLLFAEDKREEMIAKLQRKLGISREELNKILKGLQQ